VAVSAAAPAHSGSAWRCAAPATRHTRADTRPRRVLAGWPAAPAPASSVSAGATSGSATKSSVPTMNVAAVV